ncbi:MAG: DUF4359 domain-containing protein [Rhodothermales bacterium]
MRKTLLILVILLVALAWFNPNMDAFREYSKERSEYLLLQETGDTEIGRALSNLGGALAGAFIDRITERRNYVVFSTYTIDLDGDDETKNEWHFLGIAGQFFEMQQPEAVRERARERADER